MEKFNFIKTTAWSYNVSTDTMSAVRGHKYHILPASSLPITISFAILILVLVVVSDLHPNFINLTNFDFHVFRFINLNYKVFLISFFDSKYDILTRKLLNTMNHVGYSSFDELYDKKSYKYDYYDRKENWNYQSQVYILWVAPFLVAFSVFVMWCTKAIEEGVDTKLIPSFFLFKENFFVQRSFETSENHSNLVRKGFKIGFILFIVSEVMFFFGFFFGFFHSAISPTFQIGCVWPPVGTHFITVKGFAVANTVILLTSGLTLTMAHYALELIPQKRTSLYLNGNLDVSEMNPIAKEPKYSIKPRNGEEFGVTEEYLLPAGFIKKYFFIDSSVTDKIFKLYLPFNLLLNPRKKYFNINPTLKQTELVVWNYVVLMLNLTLLLALIFMTFQIVEYFISPVHINTGVYGSTFYMITGLHGAHVFIGACFLFYCKLAVNNSNIFNIIYSLLELKFARGFVNLIYVVIYYFKRQQMMPFISVYLEEHLKSIISGIIRALEGFQRRMDAEEDNAFYYGPRGNESFECAAWYWHFVDVVWIFVFAFVYIWSHLTVLNQQ